jgi:agmatine/peptidylarginine deiminase
VKRLPALLLVILSVLPARAEDAFEIPLPKDLAPREIGLPNPRSEAPFAPPTGEVHTPPEYARNRGLLLRWTSLAEPELVAIAAAVSTIDPAAIVTIVVSGAAQQEDAEQALGDGGADLAQVDFFTAPSDSIWIRDYGPRFILEDKELAIVDHDYNRPRPLDDVIPGAFASAWSLPLYTLPLEHGGGNFHLFGDGDAFMTDLVLAENPGLTANDVETYFAAYENLDLTIWPGFPSTFDSTRHLDMWFLPVRDRVAIVGQYPVSATEPHQISEAAVTELLGRGYTVHRTPGWRASGTHYTYTNAVVFNDLVLIPRFAAYATENAAASATFAAAFPGKQIVALDADFLAGFAGIFHCVVMHVPDPDWLFEDGFETADTSVWSATRLEP